MANDNGSNDQMHETNVVIVGCGPVGAMLANLLGLQGISTLVLEREAAIYNLPRAVHFDDEVMRLLQTVDLAETMQALVHVSPGMKFVDDTGRLLLDWGRPPERGPQGWYASYRFHQPELERVLREGLARWPSVSLKLRTEVFALEQEADAMEDLGFHERWLVLDAILRRPCWNLGEHSVQHCSRKRPATYVRGTGNRRRWEIAVLPGEDEAAITQPAKVLELLKPWVEPEDVELERMAVHTFHSAIAPRWRSGRLLIAGDSAHLTPPFLGQGMCAGMRDAGNLAWKLGRVLRGQNDEGLLDTYQTERAPHVREYIELAVRLGGLINTKAMEAALPDSVLEGGDAARMTSIKPRLGPGVAAGWNSLAGQIAPQPRLADGTRLDDRVGYRFAALLQPDFVADLPADTLGRLADREVVVVADDAPEPQAWLQAADASAILVRPDRYMLGAVYSLQELNALVAAI